MNKIFVFLFAILVVSVVVLGCAKKTDMNAESSVSRTTIVNLLSDYIIPSIIYSPGFDNEKIAQLYTAKYSGVYSYGDNPESGPNGDLRIYPLRLYRYLSGRYIIDTHRKSHRVMALICFWHRMTS